jgi:hypothetical protein
MAQNSKALILSQKWREVLCLYWDITTAHPDARPPQFVAVPNLLSGVGATAAYRLRWPNGLTVEVGGEFDVQGFSALLQVVQRL